MWHDCKSRGQDTTITNVGRAQGETRKKDHTAYPLMTLRPLCCICYLQLYHKLPQSQLLTEIHIYLFTVSVGQIFQHSLAESLLRISLACNQVSASSLHSRLRETGFKARADCGQNSSPRSYRTGGSRFCCLPSVLGSTHNF